MTCHSFAIGQKEKAPCVTPPFRIVSACVTMRNEWGGGLAISRGVCGSHVRSVGSGFRPHHHQDQHHHCRIVCIRHVFVVRLHRYIHTHIHRLVLCHMSKVSTARVRSGSEGGFTLAVCCVCPAVAWLTTATAGDATLSYGSIVQTPPTL